MGAVDKVQAPVRLVAIPHALKHPLAIFKVAFLHALEGVLLAHQLPTGRKAHARVITDYQILILTQFRDYRAAGGGVVALGRVYPEGGAPVGDLCGPVAQILALGVVLGILFGFLLTVTAFGIPQFLVRRIGVHRL